MTGIVSSGLAGKVIIVTGAGRGIGEAVAKLFAAEGALVSVNALTHCPTCGSDQIKKVRRDWTGTHKGQSYVVPELAFYECPVCGERVFEREALDKIQACSPAFVKQPRKTPGTRAAKPDARHSAVPPV